MLQVDRRSSDLLGAFLIIGLLLWVASCVLDGPSRSEREGAAQQEADQRLTKARRAADLARYRDDPLLTESARKSPDGDAVTYAMSALGTRCGKLVSVTPLKTPMLYEVICSDGSTGSQLNFTKYRLNTAAGIAELLD